VQSIHTADHPPVKMMFQVQADVLEAQAAPPRATELPEGRSHGGTGASVNAALARVAALVDAGTFAPSRSLVGDGVIAGAGEIDGRHVCIWAQDVSHVGGSLGVAGGETIARTIRRANRAGMPVIGVPHSGGARLQDGVAALSAYGAIFREQALALVPQITVVPGTCAGGAAYSPALGDLVVMSSAEAHLFLTGPKVVEQVMREQISSADLGGARVHGGNGVAHLFAEDDRATASLLRKLLQFIPATLSERPSRVRSCDPPSGSPAAHVPSCTRSVYDVRDVVRALVDAGEHMELSPRWARNMVTTFAHLGGHPIGVLANQPRHLGGTIDSPASEKGAWFVRLCDRFALPIVVLVDTPGFLPGGNQERSGVIRHGADLLRAFACATTTKLTVTLRQAYGGAHIVMNSRDLGSDLALAWPDAQIGIMGARQAVAIAEHRAIAAGADADRLAEIYASSNLGADVAAADGFVDEIVAPTDTREHLVRALEQHSRRAGALVAERRVGAVR